MTMAVDSDVVPVPDALDQALGRAQHSVEAGNFERLEQFISAPSQKLISETPEVPFQPIEAIVAFIDVLGTSALMRSLTQDNAAEITHKIMGIKDLFENQFVKIDKQVPKCKLMVISDSFVISVPKEADAFSSLLMMLAECQYACLVNHGEILRGAVSTGAIIGGAASPNSIIGPAFINAHDLETKSAIFPRIVIDKAIIDDHNICPPNVKFPLALDKDGLRYIDFTAISDADLNDVRAKITTGSSQAGNDTTKRQKWYWLKTFLEQKTNACLECCKTRIVAPATP